MSMEELNERLRQEKQKDLYLVESARTALVNTGESFRKDLSESAQNFRSDIRDETKKAREAWERTTEQERQAWAEERKQWEATKRKFLMWTPVGALVLVLIVAGVTVWCTKTASAELQQLEGQKLASLKDQTLTESAALERTEADLRSARETLADIQKQIEEAKKLAARVPIYRGANGEIYVETWPEAQPYLSYSGKTLIRIQPLNN
jgi:delta 1-pyrroline-5-carboxylate dehydrogenase